MRTRHPLSFLVTIVITGGGCSRGAAEDQAVPPLEAPAHAGSEPEGATAPTEAAAPAEASGGGYTVCTPDGFGLVPAENLPPEAAGTRWFVPLEPRPGHGASIGIIPLEDAPPEALETMANLQKATASEAVVLCRVFLAGMTMGAKSADATGGGVVETSWGRTCQAELVRTDREGRRSKMTIMRAGADYLMVLSEFSESDELTPAAHDQLIGCWAEAR